MIAFRGGSENKALSRISEALGPGVTGYHCTWGFYRKLRSWSQLWACEEPVAVVGAQISPSSSPSVICLGKECTDRSQSLPQRPLSVPFQAGLDFSLGGLEPVMGV